MPWIIILILIALGVLFLLLELLVIPGTTIIGIIGVIALALGVYETFDIYGNTWGYISLFGTSVFSLVMLVLALRSKTWKRAMLSTSINSRIDAVKGKFQIGQEGVTISRLTPMGKGQFNNEYVEISTYGDFINPGTRIRIVEINNNKIFVDVVESNQ